MFLFGDFQYFYFDEETGATHDAGDSQGESLAKQIEQAFSNLAQKQGGADAAGLVLLQENRQYRDQIRTLKAQLKDASGKVPAEGAVVLGADDAPLWQAYQALGKPDELKTRLDGHAQLQRDILFRDAAAAHSYKAAVLSQLPGVSTAKIEIRETEQDGTKVKVAFVKNDDGTERPLPEYIKEKLPDFLPALATSQTAANNTAANGTPFPKQKAGGATGGDKVAEYIERQKSNVTNDETKKALI